jgi:hypothetical protein
LDASIEEVKEEDTNHGNKEKSKMRNYNHRLNDSSDDETAPLRNGSRTTDNIASASPRAKPRRPPSFKERYVVAGAMLASGSALVLCAGALLWMTVGGNNNNSPMPTDPKDTSRTHEGSSTTSQQQQQQQQQQFQQDQHVQQSYDELGRFIVEDYDAQAPFSDFLPALTGIYGKPVYAFYVNRGQGMASFGVKSKNYPIQEFQPANKAYQSTALLGFRTFLQGYRGPEEANIPFLVEPFSPMSTQWNAPTAASTTFASSSSSTSTAHFSSSALPLQQLQQQTLPKRYMYVGANEMQIRQVDSVLGIETNVTYFCLPEEDFGAFVRRTQITNVHPQKTLTLSVLDGLARMEPYGGKLRKALSNIGRTLEAWMGVYQPYNNTIRMPFYRLSTIPKDSALVQVNEAGHYCLALMETGQTPQLLPIIYDVNKVFGEDTLLLRPLELYTKSIGDIIRGPQYGLAKTASAFAAGTIVTCVCVCVATSCVSI